MEQGKRKARKTKVNSDKSKDSKAIKDSKIKDSKTKDSKTRNSKATENKISPSQDFIEKICGLYGDSYDDREEDSRPGGEDWVPGTRAMHTSLSTFQRELEDKYGIRLSTAKLRKILITGGRWTTERSREVERLYEEYGSIRQVAEALGVTEALVTMYLPYGKVVYDLEEKSGNARRIDKCREKKRKA